jgi:hypothetical protein
VPVYRRAFLLGRKEDSKNCCEMGGYICPTLDNALRKAYHKEYYGPKKKDKTEDPEWITKTTKRKRKLAL